MKIINHPDRFKDGTRVIFLKGRNKDGGDVKRIYSRVTHSVDQFERGVSDLLKLSVPTDRIYASASPRSLKSSIREFKIRQVSADYEEDPFNFYKAIGPRWESCLMKPSNVDKKRKQWFFDCDSENELSATQVALDEFYDRPEKPYIYQTKSGYHILVSPFNRTLLPSHVNNLLETNPSILWAYPEENHVQIH